MSVYIYTFLKQMGWYKASWNSFSLSRFSGVWTLCLTFRFIFSCYPRRDYKYHMMGINGCISEFSCLYFKSKILGYSYSLLADVIWRFCFSLMKAYLQTKMMFYSYLTFLCSCLECKQYIWNLGNKITSAFRKFCFVVKSMTEVNPDIEWELTAEIWEQLHMDMDTTYYLSKKVFP